MADDSTNVRQAFSHLALIDAAAKITAATRGTARSDAPRSDAVTGAH